MKKEVYVVPHSHWDREWYFTIEDSNVLLSQNMPYLMDTLEEDKSFNSYTFDAQASVIEEFLKIYPNEKERLKKLIKDKRLFIGPWYTQTDTLLVNKESIIRNLLYGTRISKELGHSLEIGYLPDIFGQNAYLPSIFNGFSIKDSILQRGIYTDDLKENLNFNWVSPDGKSVRCNNIYLGYGPGKFIDSTDEYINEKLVPMLEKLEKLNKDTDKLLLPSGGDQVLIRKELPKVIKELNLKSKNYKFILSDYETFMKKTWENSTFKNTIEGELIACQKSRIHNTIKSQRYDIKRLNTIVENKLINILEPLNVLGQTVGLKYERYWIDYVFKELFDVHAHDSIGGCNSDETNKNIINRLEKCNNIVDNLINIIKKQITKGVSRKLQKENIITVFNTGIKDKREPIKVILFSKKESVILKTIDGKTIDTDITKCEYISGGKSVVVTASGEVEVELEGYYRLEALIYKEEVKALSYKTFIIEENEKENTLKNNESFIENELYKIEALDSKINLTNKKTGLKIRDFITFEDSVDAGDSYDYSPDKDSKEIIIKDFKITDYKKTKYSEVLTVTHKAMLPKDLKNRKLGLNTYEFEIVTELELRSSEEFIRVNHKINNNIKDHRIRVIVKSNINSNYSIADQAFSTIKRENTNPYIKTWREEGFVEAPLSIYGLENFVALRDEKSTLSLITEGIKEYQILDNSSIALTLFRSVGVLGRDDLLIRPGRASGINNKVVYTKDSEMIRELEFNYAIYFGDETKDSKLFKETENFINRYVSYQNQSLNTFEERLERFVIPDKLNLKEESDSLFYIDNNEVFLSALKESYDSKGTIIRLFNPGANSKKINIKGKFKNIFLTDLYEEKEEEIKEIIIEKYSYITLKIK